MSNATQVMLSIYSEILMKGEEPEIVDMMTEGKFYNKEGAKYFIYEETDLSGMKGDRTTLKLIEKRVVMRRYGANTSELSFEKGKRFESLYHTPYGDFPMEVLSQEASHTIDELGNGEIKLGYQLSIRGIGETKTRMVIKSRVLSE